MLVGFRSGYPSRRSALILSLGTGSSWARQPSYRASGRRPPVGGLWGLWGPELAIRVQLKLSRRTVSNVFAGMLTLAAAAIELAKLSGSGS